MIKLTWLIFSTATVVLSSLYKRTFENAEELLSLTFDTKLNSLISLNVVICGMLFAAKLVERLIFREFRSQEFAKATERLVNYLLLKVVFFVGGVAVTTVNHLIIWSIWFSIIGSLYLASSLCKDRFEYLSQTVSKLSDHIRILSFLAFINVVNILLFTFLYLTLYQLNSSILALLAYEHVAVLINSAQLLMKYYFYFSPLGEEQKSTRTFLTHIFTDTLLHVVTILHYCQIFSKHGITFTLLDVVLILNLHSSFQLIKGNLLTYSNYCKVDKLLNGYPSLLPHDLQVHNDNCPICREAVQSGAKKLPCSHIYHESCLRLWIQHCLYSPNCPTCRRPLVAHDDPVPPRIIIPEMEVIEQPVNSVQNSALPVVSKDCCELM